VVVKPREELTKEVILEFLQDKVAKWRLPDDVVFLEEIPKTSVSKFSKKELSAPSSRTASCRPSVGVRCVGRRSRFA
jgi:non-ribosomal peptide synthetase component E (peptide arylation enzyme)